MSAKQKLYPRRGHTIPGGTNQTSFNRLEGAYNVNSSRSTTRWRSCRGAAAAASTTTAVAETKPTDQKFKMTRIKQSAVDSDGASESMRPRQSMSAVNNPVIPRWTTLTPRQRNNEESIPKKLVVDELTTSDGKWQPLRKFVPNVSEHDTNNEESSIDRAQRLSQRIKELYDFKTENEWPQLQRLGNQMHSKNLWISKSSSEEEKQSTDNSTIDKAIPSNSRETAQTANVVTGNLFIRQRRAHSDDYEERARSIRRESEKSVDSSDATVANSSKRNSRTSDASYASIACSEWSKNSDLEGSSSKIVITKSTGNAPDHLFKSTIIERKHTNSTRFKVYLTWYAATRRLLYLWHETSARRKRHTISWNLW